MSFDFSFTEQSRTKVNFEKKEESDNRKTKGDMFVNTIECSAVVQ